MLKGSVLAVKTSMEYYKDVIILLLIIVPYLVFVRHTYIDKNRETFRKAILAVTVGWAMVIASAAIIMGVDYLLASNDFKLSQIKNGAADRLLFAALLGWVFPGLVIFFAWVLHLGINKARRRWFSHILFRRF